MTNNLKIIKWLYVLNDLPLLPCVYITFWSAASHFTEVEWIWTREFLGWILPIYFLRCFYLPYITSAAIAGFYLYNLIKNKFPKIDTVIFIVLTVICILGLISVETAFNAAMSV